MIELLEAIVAASIILSVMALVFAGLIPYLINRFGK